MREVIVVDRTRLSNLYSTVGKLYAELSDFDEALHLLGSKLDEGLQAPAMREHYYRVLQRQRELKDRLDISVRELHSHGRHRRSSILKEILARP
jgi:hypothetical protein